MRLLKAQGDGLRSAVKTVTFTGAAGLGAVGTVDLFTVTGRVLVWAFYGYITVSLTEAAPTATLNVGVASNTDSFIVNPTAGVTAWDANDFMGVAASVDSPGDIALGVSSGATSTQSMRVLAEDIIATVGAQAVDGGAAEFGLLWRPLSSNGLLVPA